MAPRRGEKRTNWLLIKAKDEEARAADEPDILVEEPQSVASGRSIEQVGEGDDVWDSSAGRMARGNGKKAVSNKVAPKRASKSQSAPHMKSKSKRASAARARHRLCA